MLKNFLVLFFVFLCSVSWGNYTYENLKIKDYEQMRKIVNSYIQKTQKTTSNQSENKESDAIDPDEALSKLKVGLKILFMRPDTDGLRSSLLSPLETEINTYKPFIDVLAEVVKEALPVLKNKKKSPLFQANALYIVENSISHARGVLKPEADVIFLDIKTSKIKLSEKLINHLRLNEGRGQTASPSHIAKKILKERRKERKAAQKKAEAAKKKAAKEKAAKEKAAKKKAAKEKKK